MIDVAKMKPLTVKLVRAARFCFDASEGEIIGTIRDMRVCHARWAIWFAMRSAGLSLQDIASRFGKNHTTIIYGLRRADELAAESALFRRKANALASMAKRHVISARWHASKAPMKVAA